MKPFDAALLTLWFVLLVVRLQSGEGILPVLTPVESPFPAEDGPWLLLSAEANELSGTLGVGNATVIREAVGANRHVLDYSGTVKPEPWPTALSWAKEKSDGKPYYVYRDGSKASEGLLSGDHNEQLQTLKQAIGVE